MTDRGNSYACGNSGAGNSAYNGGPGTVNDYTGGPLNGDWHWWYRP